MMDKTDWRGGDFKMTDLISRLHSRPDRDAFADVTLSLPDGSQLKAHKFVLAMASPVFEAQFFGPFADSSNNNPVTIKDVDSTAFRRLIDCIYRSSTKVLKTEINIKEHIQDYWLLLQAAHMYLVSNVMRGVSDNIIEHLTYMFCLNKAQHAQQHHYLDYPELANEDFSDLVDIMNQASELSISENIAEWGSTYVVYQLPELAERDLLNKFSDSSIKFIVEAFERCQDWDGDAIAALDLVSDIQRNSYTAPEILQTCVGFLGSEIEQNWTTKNSWIKSIEGNTNVDWSRPNWKKFIRVLRKMSWKKLCEEGQGILKIVEHLDEYSEGGKEDDWDVLRGELDFTCTIGRDYQTDWSLWEQENNKIDIYSELLKFAHEHNLQYMVDHCKIRLAKKILTWSSNDSVDAFADLQRNAEDSESFNDLVKLAKEVIDRRKN